jgi:uncharacterized protein YbjT (DUF2867 family)
LNALILSIDRLKLVYVTNPSSTTLVLGGTGKTGSRLTARLGQLGLNVRTAARKGADVHFDWDDGSTHPAAVDGIERMYLVAPIMRMDFAETVGTFLDVAEGAEIRHVTFLSEYGIDTLPTDDGPRAVEQDLIGRGNISHSILRPAWFMQNFSEGFLYPRDGAIALPTGGGSEAFIDCDDIAAVAAATLANPDAHAGAAYALSGPEAITVADVADIIAEISGKPVIHLDLDREMWIEAMIGAGVPAGYAAKLRILTETIASGIGARPNDDVERVTGRPPTSFADFARSVKQAWG